MISDYQTLVPPKKPVKVFGTRGDGELRARRPEEADASSAPEAPQSTSVCVLDVPAFLSSKRTTLRISEDFGDLRYRRRASVGLYCAIAWAKPTALVGPARARGPSTWAVPVTDKPSSRLSILPTSRCESQVEQIKWAYFS